MRIESSDRQDRVTTWLVSAAGVVALLAHLAASVRYSNWTWGLHHYFFLGRVWTVGLIGLGLLLCLPWVWMRLVGTGPRGLPRENPSRLSPVQQDLLIAGAFAAVFWFLRMPLHFLGDGRLMIRLLDQGLWFHPHEPLNRLIHAGLLRATRVLFGWNAETVYASVSVASGLVYVFAALRLGRLLGHRLWTAALLVTLGTIALFFGYAESYPLATAVMLAYVLLALEYLEGSRRLVWVAVCLVLGIALHFALGFLIPSALYLLWSGPRRAARRGAGPFVAGVVISILIVALLLVGARRLAPDEMGLLLVPLVPHPVAQYTMFSWEHLVDFLNEQTLISPLAWMAACAFLVAFLTDAHLRRSSRFRFLLIAAACGFLFGAVLRPGLGGSRDWDLWSMGSLPCAVAAIAWLVSRMSTRPPFRASVWILVISGFFHVAPWIAVNHSRALSLDRFDRMLDDNALWTAKRMAAARTEVASFYLALRQWDAAAGHLEKAVRLDPERAQYWCHLGTAYLMLGRLDEAEDRIRRSLEMDPDYAKAYCGLAQVYLQQGRYSEAEIGFCRSLEIDPNLSSSLLNLGSLYRAQGEMDMAIDAYARATELDPQVAFYWQQLARTLERVPGRQSDALDAWKELESLSVGDPDLLEMLEEAQRRIEILEGTP